jgi:hypothetical protein
MSRADAVKTIGQGITAAGEAIRATHIPNLNSVGLALQAAGEYISGSSEALIESFGDHSAGEIAGRMLTSFLYANGGSDPRRARG